jgi:hypothetical protein
MSKFVSMNRLIFLCLAFALALGCRNKPTAPGQNSGIHKDSIQAQQKAKASPVQYIDTEINIKNIPSDKPLGKLTEDKVRKLLREYFKKQKIYEINTNDKAEVIYFFDTLYFANINGDNHVDAIVVYTEMPARSSGHCFTPEQGIIISTSNGYSFINEDFMGEFFCIDSVVDRQTTGTFLYGGYFDCGGTEKITRRLKVHLITGRRV